MATYSRNETGRRAALGLLLGAAVLPFAGTRAEALDVAEAHALIDRVVFEIKRIINSGKSEQAMYRDFEGIFDRYADVPTIARSALGPPARTASRAQLAAFGDAFGAYLARKYGAQFREFIGGEIEVKKAKKVKSFYEVKTIARLRGESPFEVTFLISDRSGNSKFFNIFIEGVNMLLTERTEIGAMLDKRRGDIDALIRDLKSIS